METSRARLDLTQFGPVPAGVKARELLNGVEIIVERRYTRAMERGISAYAISAMVLLILLPASAAWGPDSLWTVIVFSVGVGLLAGVPALAAVWAERRGVRLGTPGGTIHISGDQLRVSHGGRRFAFPFREVAAVMVEPKARLGSSAGGPLLPRAGGALGQFEALEIATALGRVRCFEAADPPVLEWTAAALRRALDRPAWPPADAPPAARHAVISAANSGGGTRIAIALVGFAIAVAAVGWAANEIASGWASRSWATVDGHVTASTFERVRSRRWGSSHDVAFRYEYEVGGRTYSGGRIGFGYNPVGNVALDIVKAHAVGSQISVHYDPRDPARSAILTGVGVMPWFPLAIGPLMLAGSLYLAGRRRGSEAQRALVRRYRVPWLALPPPPP